MKKLSYLFVALLSFLVVPFTVMAEGEEVTSKEPVPVYLFRGDSCPHCEEAIAFFDSIEEQYGLYFDLKSYEVWNDQENSNLMQEVAKKLGDEVSGVPYIIIGDKTWNGYSSSMNSELETAIMELYESDNRFDALNIPEKVTNNAVSVVIIACVVLGLGAILYFGRKATDTNTNEDKEDKELEKFEEDEQKEEEPAMAVKEEKVSKKTSSKSSKKTSKKSTTKKTTTKQTKKTNSKKK